MPTLHNLTRGRVLSTSVIRADTGLARLVGALGWTTVEPQRGIWFEACSAVHTLGMRVALDIVFLAASGDVVGLRRAVRPNRFVVTHRTARHVLEMGAGFIDRSDVQIGDRLAIGSPAPGRGNALAGA